MKNHKSALPRAILGLALLFSACTTSSGVDKLPTTPQKKCPGGWCLKKKIAIP